MSKDFKTKIAFACMLLILPLLVLNKLNYLDTDLTIILMIISWILSMFFGKDYIKSLGKK